MARAGGRKYARDKNGRFASTGGGGGKPGRAMASAVGKAEKQRSNRAAAVDKMPKAAGGKRPKTAAGRAKANLRAATSDKSLSRKSMRSARTAQKALDYYKANGGGRKGAAKPAPKSTAGKGTAAARGAVIRARAKAGASPTRGQKAALTKATNKLKAAKAENTSAKNMRRPKMAGTISRPKRGRK